MILINKLELIKLSVGMIGNSFAYMIFYFLLPVFYKEYVFKPSLSLLGLDNILNTVSFSMITIPFAISALVYIFSGHISDKTRTRFGRRRPYLLLVIPSAACFIFLGLPPNILISMGFPQNYILLLILGTLYVSLYRILYCNYIALYVDLTPPNQRVSASISINLFGMIGTIATFIIPLVFEGMSSFLEITALVGSIYLLLMLFVFFLGHKEDLEKINKIDLKEKIPGFFKSFKDSITDYNFKYYLSASFFFVLAYSLMTTVFMDFLKFKQTYIPVEFWNIFLVLLIVAVFGFWFYSKMSKKRGKIPTFKIALYIGFLVQPFMIFLGIAGSPLSLIIQLIIVFAILLFVLLAVLTFQNAILMDIAPPDKEATYSGIWLFVSVIGMPVASGLVGLINDVFINGPPILNFWIYRTGEYPGHDFAYALLLLIASISYFISYLFLRKVKYKEELNK
ncbi:MAG: MFS transporter [Candidatus Helarchaeota archaeon]